MECIDIEKDLIENFDEYSKTLESYLRKRYFESCSDDDIRDIVSETFVKALKNKDKFLYKDDGSSLIKWLVTIARNTALNDILYSKKDYMYDYEEVRKDLDNFYFTEQSELDDRYEKVMNVLKLLDKDLRDIIIGYMEGYSYKELADMFKVPLGTIKSRIHFTRKRILESVG